MGRQHLLQLLLGATIACFITYAQPWKETPREIMAEVTNEFGICVLQLVASRSENVAFSPYGLMSVSVILYEGARGPTAAEIHNSLRLPWDRLVTRQGFRDLHRYLKSYFTNDGFLRGLVLSKPNVPLRPDYLDLLQFYGFSTNVDTTPATPGIREDEFNVTTTPGPPGTMGTRPTVVVEASPTLASPTEPPRPSTTTRAPDTPPPTSTPRDEELPRTTVQPTSTVLPSDKITAASTGAALTSNKEEATTSVAMVTQEAPAMPEILNQINLTDIEDRAFDHTSGLVSPKDTSTSTPVENSPLTPFEVSVSKSTISQTVTMSMSNTDTPAPTTALPDTTTSQETTSQESTENVEVTSNIPTPLTTADKLIETLTPEADRIATTTAQSGEPITTVQPPSTDTSDSSSAETDTQTPESITNSTDTTESESTESSSESNSAERQRRDIESSRLVAEHRDGSLMNWISRHQSPYMFNEPVDQWFFTFTGGEDVPVLTYTAYLPYAYLPDVGALVLQVPLDDPRYSMVILLPEERYGLTKVLQSLLWFPMQSVLSALKPTAVYAVVPTFTIVRHINLVPALAELGIRRMFDPFKSDLSDMSPEPNVYVRTIEQVVTVSLRKYHYNHRWFDATPNEVQQNFIANHPFVYFVIDKETKVALMAGTIVNPVAYNQ